MTDLEVLEAAAKLGRKLERLEADKAEAQREWAVRLDKRYAEKREELVAGAAAEVLKRAEQQPKERKCHSLKSPRPWPRSTAAGASAELRMMASEPASARSR